jgi:hypothetical protein
VETIRSLGSKKVKSVSSIGLKGWNLIVLLGEEALLAKLEKSRGRTIMEGEVSHEKVEPDFDFHPSSDCGRLCQSSPRSIPQFN